MASRLLGQFKQNLEGLEMQPSSGGCFEITVDDKLIYSKLDTGDFPSEDAIVEQVGTLLA